ncbi:MAG: hypothetical protein AUK44_09215, partial [Porphyromonadaceae bacterium CG2_30_38_12]
MKNILIRIIVVSFIGFVVHACANKAQGPTGGPKDITPPRVMKSTPSNGALNFRKKEIQIIFDENISIEKPSESIIISPPQSKQPNVKGNARVLSIDFEDELTDSTTYTINFGNSIVDLNEKNPLKDFRFAFATGNQIDTMQVAGQVIDAENLNPVSGIIVGIYAYSDSDAFFKKPFLRIAKTDENGHFVIDNAKPGKYRIYALGDVSKDYFYQPGESAAFSDSLLSPSTTLEQKHDTIWKDSVTVDSIHSYIGTRFLPDSVLLKLFKEKKKRQYFVKYERKKPMVFTLFFHSEATQPPTLKPLNFDWTNRVLVQKNSSLDSISYWLKDSSIYNIDTLSVAMTYQKTDSLYQLVLQTDTLHIIMRKAAMVQRKKTTKTVGLKTEFYKIGTNASTDFDVFNPLLLTFEAPMDSINLAKVYLKEKVDSTFKTLPLKWRQVDSTGMLYAVNYKWQPEKMYELRIDSAAISSIYGLKNNSLKAAFKVKSLDEYAAIKLKTAVFDSLLMFQVLDAKDKVLVTKKAMSHGTLFEYLKPGDYYLRAFKDANANGLW